MADKGLLPPDPWWAFERAPVALVVVADDGRVASANRAARDLLRVEDAVAPGTPLDALLGDAGRDAVERLLEAARHGARAASAAVAVPLAGDARAPRLRLSLAAPEDGDATPHHVLRLEEAPLDDARALAAERQLADLVNGVEAILWEADAGTFEFTFVSRRAEAILGYPVDAWLTHPTFWADHIHPLDRDWAVGFCVAQTAEAKDHEFEYRMVAADGRTVWVRDVVFVERDAVGRATRLRGVMLDITSRKDAELRLAMQNAVTTSLVEAGSVEEAGPAMLRAIGESVGWELGAVWTVDRAAGVLRAAATWRARSVEADEPERLTRETTFQSGEGLPGRVWASRRASWIADVALDPALPRGPALARAGLRAGFAFPVIGRDGLHGVIEFFGRHEREPDEALVSAMASIGSQVGLFVERRRAEAALRESDARKGAIVGAALDAVLTIDHEGRVTDWNPAAETIFGYARDEVLGRTMADLIVPPAYRERHLEGLRRHMETGESSILGRRLELPALRRDGTEFPVELALARLQVDGRPAFTGFIRDITARKAAEARLAELLREVEEQRRRLAAIVSAVPGVVWEAWDEPNAARQRVDFVSGHVRTLLGYAPEEWLAARDFWAAIVHPDDRRRVEAEASRVLAERGGGTLELRWVAKDGGVLDVLAHVAPILDHQGRAVGMRGVAIDVTERRAAEAALREKEERLRAALDASLTGTFRWDVRTGTLEWDGNLDRLFGLPPGVTARHLDEFERLVHPADRPSVLEALSRSVGEGADFDLEFRVVRPDGSVRWLLDRGRMVTDAAGQPLYMAGACVDVTERKRVEETLRQRAEELARLAEMLARSNRELDQFAYITSHDLKAPLRGIANLSRWIEEDLDDRLTDESRRNLELLRGRVHRMESLIDAILEYSRVGRVQSRTERVDVGALLRETVDLVSPPPGFRVEVTEGMPVVTAERARLAQVFMNLVSNAIKHHHKPHGTVRIDVEDAGSHWRFSVADDGPGIHPRFHERVFVIFQTLEARDKVEGTGVGLALVKKIVESQGGEVTLESDEGKGATFRFTWPKQTEES